jgi:hypothetical protein
MALVLLIALADVHAFPPIYVVAHTYDFLAA